MTKRKMWFKFVAICSRTATISVMAPLSIATIVSAASKDHRGISTLELVGAATVMGWLFWIGMRLGDKSFAKLRNEIIKDDDAEFDDKEDAS